LWAIIHLKGLKTDLSLNLFLCFLTQNIWVMPLCLMLLRTTDYVQRKAHHIRKCFYCLPQVLFGKEWPPWAKGLLIIHFL
jgi:hypothetical protein